MDCEKFETTMIDELYGELDELTSAASKRHVAGCARCSALIGGLRATRRVATLPVVAPSEGFEERLLAATRDARSKMKPKVGMAQVISWGGRWAMRPQTAMAAVFLLMIGTSGMFLTRKSPKYAASGASASFTVTENGAPDTPAADKGGMPASVDPMAAAAAHGVPIPPRAAPAPMAAASVAPSPTSADPDSVPGNLDDSNRAAWASKPAARARPMLGALGGSSAGYGNGAVSPKTGLADQEEAPKGWAAPPPPPPAAAEAQASQAQGPAKKDATGFSQGRAQYAARDYGGAQQTFDGLATQGDVASALWAARSVRDGSGGCALAASRFDSVAGQAWGTATGYDATLEGGECYRALGQPDAARTRFARLLTVPAYASRAQADIDAMSQVAAKARRASPKAVMAPAAAAPAAPPPAQQQQAPVDRSNSYK